MCFSELVRLEYSFDYSSNYLNISIQLFEIICYFNKYSHLRFTQTQTEMSLFKFSFFFKETKTT